MLPRRVLLRTAALGLIAVPRAVAAQTRRVWRVGFLGDGPRAERVAISLEPFRMGLRGLGYVEGQNLAIEERWTDGRVEQLPLLVEDLVRLKVDVIVTHGVRAIRASQAATTAIPIVMAVSPDPIATGLVASLSRPGGNTTGLTDQVAELGEKEVQVLRDVVPGVRRVAILWHEGNPGAQVTFDQTRVAAAKVGLGITIVGVRSAEELDGALAQVASGRPDALIVIHDVLTVSHRARIARLALQYKLPSICGSSPYVDAGGLVAYAPDLPALFSRAAVYVDRILRGAAPANLPIEQPTRFQLRINLRTARALGLTIPPAVLARADEVIE